MKKTTIATGDKVILNSTSQEVEIAKIEHKCCGNESRLVAFVNYPKNGFIDRKVTLTFKDGSWAYGYEIRLNN